MKTKSALYEALETLFPNFRKICVVTNCFPPYPKDAYSLAVGGISRKYEEIAEELQRFKKALSVISLYYCRVSDYQDASGVYRIGVYRPYTHYKTWRFLFLLEFFNPLVFSRCVTILSRERPDSVIIGSSLQISLAPILAAKLLGIPVVVQHDWLCPSLSPRKQACSLATRVTDCGKCLEEEIMSRQNRVVKLIFGSFSAFMLLVKKSLWNRCLVFAEGDYFRDLYVASGIKPERILIVPPSPTVVDSTDCDRNFLSRLRAMKGDAKIIAYVGRLSAEKGITLLLESFRILRRRADRAFKLVIAGDGIVHDLVCKEAKNDSAVVFLGWVEKDRLKCVYEIADIVVIPTIRPEAFPHVALEALAFNKKVVGFRMGGLLEIAKKNKLVTLVDKTDPQSLANAMLTLMDSEK